MKIIQTTSAVLGVLFILGTAQEGNAAVSQLINPPAPQDYFILTHGGGGHGGHGHGGHRHDHGGHRHGGHGLGWGAVGVGVLLGAPALYGPSYQKVCGYDDFGNYVCQRQYY